MGYWFGYSIFSKEAESRELYDGTNTRTVTIDYTDSFNSSGIAATYAYPTKITDPAESEKICRGLRTYCHLDTLAMVEIFKTRQHL